MKYGYARVPTDDQLFFPKEPKYRVRERVYKAPRMALMLTQARRISCRLTSARASARHFFKSAPRQTSRRLQAPVATARIAHHETWSYQYATRPRRRLGLHTVDEHLRCNLAHLG